MKKLKKKSKTIRIIYLQKIHKNYKGEGLQTKKFKISKKGCTESNKSTNNLVIWTYKEKRSKVSNKKNDSGSHIKIT